MRIAAAAVIASLPMFLAPVQAQHMTGPSDNARYTFHRVQDAFLRLDAQTGQVSQCGWAAIGWYCRVVPDERAALESEITRLLTNNTALKKDLLARGLPLPDGVKSDPQVLGSQVLGSQISGSQASGSQVSSRSSVASKSSSDTEPNRTAGSMEKVWRRMVEMMVNLQRDMLPKS